MLRHSTMQFCRILIVVAMLGALAADTTTVIARQPLIDQSDRLKAAWLKYLGQFTTWPKNVGNANTFVIGVLGGKPYGNHLDSLTAKTIGDRRIVVRYFTSANQYQPCQILLISPEASQGGAEPTAEARLQAALKKTLGAPVLIVSDGPGLEKKGAMINYGVQQNLIKLQIDRGKAQAAGLRFDPRLLRLSIVEIVEQEREE